LRRSATASTSPSSAAQYAPAKPRTSNLDSSM
jgi:hypothetical protein